MRRQRPEPSRRRVPRPRARRPPVAVLERARRVRLVLLDADGVLTDGRIILDSSGREFTAFHVHDGYGVTLLLRAGVRVAFVSPRRSAAIAHRGRDLGVSAIVHGVRSTVATARRLCRRWRLGLDEVAYVGDDLCDQPLLASVGLAVAVATAATGLDRHVHWRTSAGGGAGAVREVAELVLRAQGKWASTLGDALR